MGSNPSFPFGIGLQNVGQGWDWLLRIPWTNICSESVGREHTAVTAAGVTLDTWAWLVYYHYLPQSERLKGKVFHCI